MPQSKLEKQSKASSRSEAREKRGHKGQIARLDSLFGQGQGATKERARLKGLIEEASRPKRKEPDPDAKPKKKSKKEG